jgi:polysaccharide chain length determinant protein (PEP-CTERM system associated)
MADLSDDQRTDRRDIHHYLDVVRRRHLHFLIPLLIGWSVVWGASWLLQPRYKSSTLILVEQPTMPKNYVMPNVSDDLQDRLQSITQQILSRTRLLLIINKLHLYSEKSDPVTPDEKVDRMRKDIGKPELEHDVHNNEITTFRINYSAHDPHVAQQVTGELTNLFINENLKVRQHESEDTTKFIESQLETARASLEEQEAKVKDFEARHMGQLPSQQASNLQILSGLQAQLQNEQDSLNSAKQQRVFLQAQIEQYKSLRGTPLAADATPTELAVNSLNQELDRLRAKLADLSSRYTDRYPDVLSLKDQIARTEHERDRLLADSQHKEGDAKRSAGGASAGGVGDRPQSAPMMQLQSQLQSNQAEISNREQAITALKARINEYQARLNDEPESEQQLADLTRGYDQSKANYDDLLKKKNDSQMATSMEQMEQGERFTMLDPPSLPLKPDFPNRLKFCGIGLVVGLALGFAVVGGFEFLDDRLYSEKEIKDLLSTGVISEIPEVCSVLDVQMSRRRVAWHWAMAALVVATIVAGSAFSYLHD